MPPSPMLPPRLPAEFNRLAWSNLAAQSAEQIGLAAAPIVAVLTLGGSRRDGAAADRADAAVPPARRFPPASLQTASRGAAS